MGSPGRPRPTARSEKNSSFPDGVGKVRSGWPTCETFIARIPPSAINVPTVA